MAIVLLPSPLGERVGCFIMVQFRGYASRSLAFRPTISLSTLRLVRYRTRRKTRYLTAGEALSGPPSQTAGHSALARRNSHPTGHAGHVYGGSVASACPRMPRHWRVAPHSSITPGRASYRASDPLLACTTVQAFPASPQVLCRLLTPPMRSERIPHLSATFRGTPLPEAHERPPAGSGHTVRASTPDV
jgi:hypothetical protein